MLDTADAFVEFIQVAKNEGYNVPINERWQGLQNIRCSSYEEAQQQLVFMQRRWSM
ncbi:MAG: hypothetical protein AB8W37_00680 [Arsenophonus endosymbiont of Dermacentor nuttalli]